MFALQDMELTGMCFINEGGCRRFDDQKLAADLSGLCRGGCLVPADIRLQFVTLDHGRCVWGGGAEQGGHELQMTRPSHPAAGKEDQMLNDHCSSWQANTLQASG
jgi:hypothetical protein